MSQTPWIFTLAFFFIGLGTLLAQTPDQRTLFTVESKPVSVEEFTYIYSKTNGDEATFSEESLQEYLDLYIKFKLKVQRAKEMRLDTIKALQEELAGYRRQLADSYLIDRAIGDKLIEEAYAHTTEDVDISHILFGVGINADPKDTLVVYNQAVAAMRRLEQGEDYEAVARNMSMDKYSRDKGGRVGFVTALFPAGMHNLENAAYRTPIGQVVGPIRTHAGYHLLKVHARRPARGEVEAAHIMIRNSEDNPSLAKTRIDSVYQALQEGASFDALARALSQDGRSARNGGYLGFFGINRYEKSFEDAAFGLTEDDSYSKPFQTSLGWHIIKRISRKEIQPFEAEKPRLEGKVRQDPRFEDAKAQLLRRIREDNNFREKTAVLENFVTTLPDTFTTFRWKAPAAPSPEELFRLNKDYVVTLGEFTDYLGKSTRQRVTYAREGNPETVARRLYEQFIDDQLLKYEETQLENRYPEFRSLMREYEEGILLFEATKLEVWDRAAQDSTGLQAFYEQAPSRYRWAPRAVTTVYRVGYTFKEEAEDIRTYARNHTAEEVKARFNTEDEVKVTTEDATVEKFRNPQLATVEWETGAITGILENRRSRSLTFTKIEDTLPEQNKTLQEARGYVIADYQDYLEKEWVKELRNKYKVKVDQKVFKSLIR